MSLTIPTNLNEIFSKMQGYRKNLIRWYADRTGVINANDVLRFTFPKEILDLDSLMHYFEFTSTAAASGTGSVRQGTFFPRNSASIIDTITVFINGQVFENITSYNHLFNLIFDNTCGHNFYQSGMRAIECADPSIRYSITNAGVITGTVQGATSTATTDATACDNARPLQITNWIGFLGTCNRIVDFTDVEVVVEIRYAPANIMFLGAAVPSPSALTPSYTINNYYMTAQKITFDDDDYYRALNSLKSSGNYILTFKTYTGSRSGSVEKSTNPNLQFSSTAKHLSKLYFTFIDGSFNTMGLIENSSPTISFNENSSNLRTNVNAFNQSKFFQKNGISLTEAQVEINGIPVYPFPQSIPLIHNNNYEALDMLGDKQATNFIGVQSLESWSKYCFLMATSFEHKDAYKNNIITSYPNPNRNLLNIIYRTTFSSPSGSVFLQAWAERVVQAIFKDSSVVIDM